MSRHRGAGLEDRRLVGRGRAVAAPLCEDLVAEAEAVAADAHAVIAAGELRGCWAQTRVRHPVRLVAPLAAEGAACLPIVGGDGQEQRPLGGAIPALGDDLGCEVDAALADEEARA